ncbi:uncharacterized protein KY384_004071 [Bacidia gigantensis]|uniref:uncharacterized protein n=1 Tax=Bacidia gigantensis TaxID=2732470 RepID=UPI001D043294|nr:uncharacterized protein KY384_004071 [Bacidia gigantensis]KAG8530714.1 hypothetical protein KY384_004071 [Bacidia gigantensis]
MSLYQIAVEYVLVYSTAVGLTALGEPTLASPPGPLKHTVPTPNDGRDSMPVWIIFIFVFLAFAKWFISFLILYITTLLTTVAAVATTRIRTLAALNASTHSSSQRGQLDNLVRAIRVVGAFKSARTARTQSQARRQETARRLSLVSVHEVKLDLKRRTTLEIERKRGLHEPKPPSGPIGRAWHRVTSYPCFRGFSALVTVGIAQWLLAFVTDFFLSGQPPQHKLGYGTTSLVLKTFFASFYAVWTHYTITKPTRKGVDDHFPKGDKVLTELWPMTALWAVADHICLSGPLAISRAWGLKEVAFDAESWNRMSPSQLRQILAKFAIVWMVYVVLTLLLSIPVTILTRRVHASMLSDEDLAIVPFHRGDKTRTFDYAKRAHIKKPGLTAGEAWETITLGVYWRVVKVCFGSFLVGQGVNAVYWVINWKLQTWLGVGGYRGTKLPWSPIGVLVGLGVGGNLPDMGDVGKTEL